jgi:hypothetical protein
MCTSLNVKLQAEMEKTLDIYIHTLKNLHGSQYFFCDNYSQDPFLQN